MKITFGEILNAVNTAKNKKRVILYYGRAVRAAIDKEEKNTLFLGEEQVEVLYSKGYKDNGELERDGFVVAHDIYDKEHIYVLCHGSRNGTICGGMTKEEAVVMALKTTITAVTKITVVCCFGGRNSDFTIKYNGQSIPVYFYRDTINTVWTREVPHPRRKEVQDWVVCVETTRCEKLRVLRQKLLDIYYSL